MVRIQPWQLPPMVRINDRKGEPWQYLRSQADE